MPYLDLLEFNWLTGSNRRPLAVGTKGSQKLRSKMGQSFIMRNTFLYNATIGYKHKGVYKGLTPFSNHVLNVDWKTMKLLGGTG